MGVITRSVTPPSRGLLHDIVELGRSAAGDGGVSRGRGVGVLACVRLASGFACVGFADDELLRLEPAEELTAREGHHGGEEENASHH